MQKKKRGEHSAYARQLAYQDEMYKIGCLVVDYDRHIGEYFDADILVTGMSIRHPMDEGQDYLVTLRAVVSGDAKVAFHAGATFQEVLVGLINRMKNRSLKWKDDGYA